MAKRAGLKVAHIESGLRSFNIFHPFPEEIIRIICMRLSAYLFAPSDGAVENIKKMRVRGEDFNTGGNTGIDALNLAPESGALKGTGMENLALSKPYVLVSIHRFENLYSKRRLRFILDTVERISAEFQVLFVMHGPTEKRLKKFRRKWGKSNSSIRFLPLQDFFTFSGLIKGAEFVVTDGGSVQEECSYLGKPCLIMRKRTEREDGLGANAVMSMFDIAVCIEFIENYERYKRGSIATKESPSMLIVDKILSR